MDGLLEQGLLLAIAFVANTLSALAGGGAGLIQFPALIFLGLPFGIALATHKVASVALGIGATARNFREGGLAWKFTLFILLSGLPGVFIGASFILQVPDDIARFALGLLTIALGCYSVFQAQLGQHALVLNRNYRGYIIGGLVLFLIGILNGSLTSGTGLFVTLWLVVWFGLEYKAAVIYTLILVGMFWNGLGAVTLSMLGEIKWDWLPALIIGSLTGGYVGAHLAIKKGNRLIKRIFEVITIAVGLTLMLGSL